jgi:hypothetical protein
MLVELLSTCAAPASTRLEVRAWFGLIVHSLVLVRVMATPLLAAEEMVDLIKELKTILYGKESAEEAEKETLNCAICMCSISDFFTASCMSCVCEGVFHKGCLERVEQVMGRRKCPYCRTEGSILSLQRVCPPYNNREVVEQRIRRVESQGLREGLVQNEKEILRRMKVLTESLHQLKQLPGGEETYSRLLYTPAFLKMKTTPNTTFCSVCHEGIMSFSDMMTQCCQCCAVYHPSCLKSVEVGARSEDILCCVGCKSVDILPEGVKVKSLLAASLPTLCRDSSQEEERREANEILEGQNKRLAQLDVRLRRVADAIFRLKDVKNSREGCPARKRRRRLAYLPP